jgi:HD-GYP domain-containing protein (c-di-GMP phosphodiesterase class II)
MRLISLFAGAALGALLVHERRARHAAQRLGAAALETLLNAIDANDPLTGAHVRRVAAYSLIIADAAGLDRDARRTIERAALFHDIGKIHAAMFDIMHDSDLLTPAERAAVRQHPELGSRVLQPLLAFYPDLGTAVLAHHERWDGSGYPRGARGRRIPLAARIVAIADAFDAMTHDRHYRSARGAQHAADAIAAGRGTQFDPQLVDLVLLPPVWNDLVSAHRVVHASRRSHDRRDERLIDGSAPEVNFRWREGLSDVQPG